MAPTRLRPKWSDEELARIYTEPHDHRRWGRGHDERVKKMIEFGVNRLWLSAADLSCGNGAVIDAMDVVGYSFKGDFAPGHEFVGPIEHTITKIPSVDLFINGETLEHLDDPLSVLQAIRGKANTLILSTPVDNWGDTNAEHYWSWSADDVEGLLTLSGFSTIEDFDVVDSRLYGEPYCYGVWRAT